MSDRGLDSPPNDPFRWESRWVQVHIKGPRENFNFAPIPELDKEHPDLYARLVRPSTSSHPTAAKMHLGVIAIDGSREHTKKLLAAAAAQNVPRDVNMVRTVREIFKELEAGLRELASAIERDPSSLLAQVPYFVATTRLGQPSSVWNAKATAKGVEPSVLGRMGFEIYPYPPRSGGDTTGLSHDMAERAMETLGMKKEEVEKRIQRRETCFVVLTKETLLSRYGSA